MWGCGGAVFSRCCAVCAFFLFHARGRFYVVRFLRGVFFGTLGICWRRGRRKMGMFTGKFDSTGINSFYKLYKK